MMRTLMAWYPSRGERLRGFPSYQQHHPREGIPSGTTPLVLPLPPPTIVQEEKGEGAESALPPPPAEVPTDPASISAAPDLIAIPPSIMHLMRGFNGGLMLEGSDRKEGMPFYLGAFLVVALDWRAQARNANLNTQALQALEARVAALEEEKKALGRQNEAYQASLKLAQEAKEEAERQLGEVMEFQADFYVREVSL